MNGEPVLVPHEFMQLRVLLRNYIHNLTTRANSQGSDTSVLAVTDFFVSEFRDFINEMVSIYCYIFQICFYVLLFDLN